MNPSSKKAIQGLYAITDPLLIADDSLYDMVSKAIDGGISVLQYRNKTASFDMQQQQAEMLNRLCQQNQVIFIINDQIKLAKNVSADGVHLGKTDQNIQLAREQLGQQAIIGLSCYNQIETALEAQQQGVDYVAFGRFFPSKTKPQAVQADPLLLIQAKQQLTIPMVAIGGINLSNIKHLAERGVDSVAIVNGIFAQHDILGATRQLVQQFNFAKPLAI
ncbi:MAG: thiamine phosphate synthase [Pseudomonadota bacterium]